MQCIYKQVIPSCKMIKKILNRNCYESFPFYNRLFATHVEKSNYIIYLSTAAKRLNLAIATWEKTFEVIKVSQYSLVAS